MNIKLKVALKRLARGFITGFAGASLTMGLFTGQSLSDLGEWIAIILVAGLAGGITGILLALDKLFRWKETPIDSSL